MFNYRKLIKQGLCGVLLIASVQVFAITSPVTQLQTVARNIFSSLDRNQSKIRSKGGVRIIHGIVNRYLIPYVNMPRMAASVLGRVYWQKASSSQKREFIYEFKSLVINTYSSAFAAYDRDRIRFYPLRSSYAKASFLRVNSVILRRNGQRIPISYNLMRSGNKWLVYDFAIENVSMVHSYRSQFASILSSGGLSALISRLKVHNRNAS